MPLEGDWQLSELAHFDTIGCPLRCRLSQKRAEKRSYIQRLRAGEIEYILLVPLTPRALGIYYRDLPQQSQS